MSKQITQEDLKEDYQELKSAAKSLAKVHKFEESLILIEGCAKIAYEFNFIENFVDEELEELLRINSEGIIPVINSFNFNVYTVFFVIQFFAFVNKGCEA